MNSIEEALNSQSSFLLAALVMSWIAILLLGLLVANLHLRLAHLERSSRPSNEDHDPFRHVVGRRVTDLVDPPIAGGPSVILLLSSGCPSCDRRLDLLAREAPGSSVAVAWRDGAPPHTETVTSIQVLPRGPEIVQRLGVRVAPFALSLDDDGVVIAAAPVGSDDALRQFMRSADVSTRPVVTHRSEAP